MLAPPSAHLFRPPQVPPFRLQSAPVSRPLLRPIPLGCRLTSQDRLDRSLGATFSLRSSTRRPQRLIPRWWRFVLVLCSFAEHRTLGLRLRRCCRRSQGRKRIWSGFGHLVRRSASGFPQPCRCSLAPWCIWFGFAHLELRFVLSLRRLSRCSLAHRCTWYGSDRPRCMPGSPPWGKSGQLPQTSGSRTLRSMTGSFAHSGGRTRSCSHLRRSLLGSPPRISRRSVSRWYGSGHLASRHCWDLRSSTRPPQASGRCWWPFVLASIGSPGPPRRSSILRRRSRSSLGQLFTSHASGELDRSAASCS